MAAAPHSRTLRTAVAAAALVLLAAAGLQPAAAQARAAKPMPQLYGLTSVPGPSASGFQRIGRLGVHTVRLQLHWGAVEDFLGLGLRDWSYFDAFVADGARAGVQVMPLLHGVPRSISPNPSTPPVRTSEERRRWATFVSDAVERYGRGGTFWELHPELPYLPVTAWQVWNEPNVPVFFGGSVKVSKYGLLLRQAAEAIRAADPAASVVTAGIFRYNVKGKGLGMAAFLKRFYSLDGIKRSFDVLALHPYAARPRGVLRISHQGRRIMKRSGDPWTPVWLTEVGWPTGGVGWKRNMLRATPRQQARWLRRTYRLIRRNRWLRVRRVYWHQYQDFDYPDSPDPWQARMGLVDVDERPKPAWYAYARAADGTP